MYDGDRTDVEYDILDIHPLVRWWCKVKITDLPTYKNYYREFQKIVGWLYIKAKISEEEYKLWFWVGLHEKFRRNVESQLKMENPQLDVTKPFEINKITNIAKEMYTRDRFKNRIPLLFK